MKRLAVLAVLLLAACEDASGAVDAPDAPTDGCAEAARNFGYEYWWHHTTRDGDVCFVSDDGVTYLAVKDY